MELPKPAIVQTDTPAFSPAVTAILHGPGDITIEILNGASSELIRNVIGALEGSDRVIFLWLTYICPIYRLGDFIIGCIVGYVFIKSERKGISIIKASLLEILVFLLSSIVIWLTKGEQTFLLLKAISENHTWPYIPFAVMLVVVFTYNYGALTKLLSNKALIWLGNMSPYTYLIHLVVVGYTVFILVGYLDLNDKKVIIKIGIIILEFVITLIASQAYISLLKKFKRHS